MKDTKIRFKNFIEYFTVCIGVFILRAFTLQGPAYDLCAEDNSIFFIVGRELLNGKVLYIDVTDHKGIYTFLIYALAALISKTSQIGVYLIYSVLMSCVMMYLYNTLRNRYDAIECIVLVYTVSLIMCWTPLIIFGGYNEEYIMLCYLTSMLIMYRHWDERYNNYKLMTVHGIMVGIILNMKPNYILFYVPIAIDLIIKTVKDKKYKTLINNILSGLMGIIIANIPMLVYTIKYNCFNEMIYNLYEVSGFDTYAELKPEEFTQFLLYRVSVMIIIMTLSVIVIRYKQKNMTIFFISVSILSLIESLISGRVAMHYVEPLVIMEIPFITYVLHKIIKSKNKIISIFLTFMILFSLTWYNISYANIVYTNTTTSDYSVCKTADLYNNEYSHLGNVIYVGYGGAIYYNTNIKVDKHFSLPCIKQSAYTEAIDYKEDRIRNENADLIIVQDWYMEKIEATFSSDILKLLESNYTKDTRYSDKYKAYECTFYLRNDLLMED